MRAIPDDFDPAAVFAIDARLAEVARSQQVRIPWAIESGSRAWGFASPDSDYDCRFFYVRARAAYIDLWPSRDVIETPLDALLDVNGWDLRKAVRLAVAGNATVGEWLRSPWIYTGDAAFREELLELVAAVADPASIRRHYLHVGRGQWAHAGDGSGTVNLKRVFYAIRPALTLVWLDAHEGVPPINIDVLLVETTIPDDVRDAVADLRVLKARTRELGSAPVPPPIGRWVDATLSRVDDEPSGPRPGVRERANQGFLALLDRWAPG